MKKYFSIALFILLSLGVVNINAQNSKSSGSKGSDELRYCSDYIDIVVGDDEYTNYTSQAAISFPAANMTRYVGKTLSSIVVGLGNAEGIALSNGKVWLASSLTGEHLYEQAFVPTPDWNPIIILQTPFVIPEGDLYIGYDITVATGKPVAVSKESPNVAHGGHVKFPGAQWATLSSYGINGNVCIMGIVEGMPDRLDLAITKINMKSVAAINTNVALSGMVKNNGNIPITSYDVTYKVGNEGAVKISVEGKDIIVGTSDNFTFPTPLTFTSVGSYDVVISVGNINGEGDNDETPADNTVTKNIQIAENVIARKVLMEHFTTEQCPQCPAGQKKLEGIVGDNKDIIWVSNHTGFGTDQYTVTSEYCAFYNDGQNSYAPAIMLDRVNLAESGAVGSVNQNPAPSPGPIFNLGDWVPSLLLERIATESSVSVAFETFNYNPLTRMLTTKISGKKIAELPGANTVITVFLVEDDLYGGDQVSGTGERHNHVLRKVISPIWGDKITFDGDNYSTEYSLKIDNNFKITNLKAVAFLGNYDGADVNNREVYNAEQVSFMSYKPAGTFVVTTSTDNEKNGLTSGDSFFTPGDEVTIKATPETGRKFMGWTLDGVEVSKEASYTFTMPSKDVEYEAIFAQSWNLTLTAVPSEAAGTCTGAGRHYATDEITITATPSEGYTFINWTLNNIEVSTDREYTFTMPNKSITYKAVFQKEIGVNDVAELDVRVYPNPAKTSITIDGEYNKLSIVDVTGKTVKTVIAQPTVDLSDLNNGVYILNIIGQDAMKIQKIVISK